MKGSVFSNIFWMIFDRGVIAVLTLILTLCMANHYGSSSFGVYQYALSLAAVFDAPSFFSDARVVKLKYSVWDRGETVFHASFSRLLLSTLTILAGPVYILISGEDKDCALILMILLFNLLFVNLRFGPVNCYEYELNSGRIVRPLKLIQTLGCILQLILIYLGSPMYLVVLITPLIALFSLILSWYLYGKDHKDTYRGPVKPGLIKAIIKESIPLGIAASCVVIYSRTDLIMTGNLLSKRDVGIYAIAVNMITAFQYILFPMQESFYPGMIELYKKDPEAYEKRYIKITSLFTWIFIVLSALSVVLLPFIFRLLKPEYAEAVPIYRIYLLSGFFIFNAGLRAGHYTMTGKGSILMYSQLFSVVLNVILNFILISRMGLYGAALATVITQCVSLLLSNLFFKEEGIKVFKRQLKGLNPLYMIR